MKRLFRSSKFWLAVLDVVVSTIVYFITKYAAPDVAEDIIWVIASWQPIVVAVIAGIAYEDGQEKRSKNY